MLSLHHAEHKKNTGPEQRKILIVISDGAPVDDSTLSTNENNLLENHLHDSISTISKLEDTELIAI